MAVSKPSSLLKNKTNPNPSVARDKEATAEDFSEIGALFDEYGNAIDANTAQAESNRQNILTINTEGITKAYQTKADLLAVSPVPAENTQAKVFADPTSSNNGYYAVISGAWVWQQPLAADVVALLQSQIDGLASGFNGALAIADVPVTDGLYIATENGTYTNAGSLVVDLTNQLVFITKDGSTYDLIEVAIGVKDIYISTSGSDSNNGYTQDTPIKTITKLKTLLTDGCTVYFSRGEVWKNTVVDSAGTLIIDTSSLLLEDEMYGNAMYFELDGTFTIKDNPFTKGKQPIFDASVTIPSASFVLNSGDSYTYKFTIETRHQNPYAQVSGSTDRPYMFEDGQRLVYYKTAAEVESNAGSFTYVQATSADPSINSWGTVDVYVHPYNSTNPSSDGKEYDYTMYSFLINKDDNKSEINLENITLQRACGKDGNHLHGGYAKNVIFNQFSSHASLKNHSIIEDCYSYDNLGDCYHGYDGDSSPNGIIIKNSSAIGSEHFDPYYSDINGTVRNFPIAYYAHASTGETISLITIIDGVSEYTRGLQLTDTKTVKALRLKQKDYTNFLYASFDALPNTTFKEVYIIDCKGYLSVGFTLSSANGERVVTFFGDGDLHFINTGLIGGYWFFTGASSSTNLYTDGLTLVKIDNDDNFDLYNATGFGTLEFKNTIFYLSDDDFDNTSGGIIPFCVTDEGLTVSQPTFEDCYLHNQFIYYSGTYYTPEEYATAFPSAITGDLKSNWEQQTDVVLGATVYKDYPTDVTPDSGTYWDYDGRWITYYFDLEEDMQNIMLSSVANKPTFKWVNPDDNKRYTIEDRYNGQYTTAYNGLDYHTGYGNDIVDDTTGISTGDGNTGVYQSGFLPDGRLFLQFDLFSHKGQFSSTSADITISYLKKNPNNIFIGNPRRGNFNLLNESIPAQMGVGFNEQDITRSEKEIALNI